MHFPKSTATAILYVRKYADATKGAFAYGDHTEICPRTVSGGSMAVEPEQA
jgi:hypothetical protein